MAEVVSSESIHQAVKRFAPKQQRRRLQLRSAEGHLQSHEAEHRQMVQYFVKLYADTPCDHATLSRSIHITTGEVTQAMQRIRPAKAMPSVCAASSLWKLVCGDVIPILVEQFRRCLQVGASGLPPRWRCSELVLLPKPGKPMTHPSQLRPINLLSMEAKILGAVLAARLQVYAAEYLRTLPQFSYLQGRTLGQAVDRVLSRCAQVRQLVANQAHTLHARRQGGSIRSVSGGALLSLDISKAYDQVPWRDLQRALEDAQVPQHLIELVIMIHQQTKLLVQHCGLSELVPLRRGLRQGCGLAPVLWAIYSGWLLKALDRDIVLNIRDSNTTYADDFLFSWLIRTGRDLENVYQAMKHVLSVLYSRGLELSMSKTVAILKLHGPQAESCLRRYQVDNPDGDGKCLKFMIAGEPKYIKVVTQHVYLGVIVSFGKFEQQTFAHRLQLAKQSHGRLKSVLKCSAIPRQLRLQLWRCTVIPTLLHGLDCSGLPTVEASTLMTQYFKQARMIAKSYSQFTHETNLEFARRLQLPNPITMLVQALQRRASYDWSAGALPADRSLSDSPPCNDIQPGEEQLQWRHLVRSQLMAVAIPDGRLPAKCRLKMVQDVLHEKFVCQECGQGFISQAALRRHEFRQHMTREQQQQRQEEPKRMIQPYVMEHSKNGMPQCRHCDHAFSTWHAFYYHVNSRSCSTLRQLLDQPVCPEQIMHLSEAVVENEEILELAKKCSWKDLALHPLVRAKHQHCPECHQWHVRSQYVKRHMLSRHPSQASLVSHAERLIVASKLSLQKPCQFCGQDYQRKDAHLRTCVGIFQGVYLYLRVARGRALQELDDGSFDCHGGGKAKAKLERGHQGAPVAAKPRPSGDDRHSPQGNCGMVRRTDDAQLRFPSLQVPQAGQQRTGGQGSARKGQRKGAEQRSQSGPARQGQGIRAFLERAGRTEPAPTTGHLDRGRRGGTGGSGRPQDDGQAPDGPCPEARIPALHQSLGHRLCELPSGGHSEQCGSQHLQDGATMACGEKSDAGAAGSPDADHSAPAPARHREGQNGEDDGDSLIQVHGDLAGMAQRERAGAHGAEVGSGGPPTRQGCVGYTDQDRRGHGDPCGAHRPDQGAAGGGEISCNQAIERAVPGSHAHHAAGDWTEDLGCSHSLERAQQVGTVSAVGGSWGFSSPGADPKEPTCPESWLP